MVIIRGSFGIHELDEFIYLACLVAVILGNPFTRTTTCCSIRYGMILFIVSEMMLFLGFFWAFGHSSLTYN
jgi:hypothetical protein